MPASRSASESGADLMNWGRFPTTESTRIDATIRGASGPLAQLVEQGTLNPKVVGSIPTRPIQLDVIVGIRVTLAASRKSRLVCSAALSDQGGPLSLEGAR